MIASRSHHVLSHCVHFPETNEPVTENTIYGLASLSKHFTTTLLGQVLSNAGKKILSQSFRNLVVDVFY